MKTRRIAPRRRSSGKSKDELLRLRESFSLLEEYSRGSPLLESDGALIFRLPLPPNMANERFHWRTKEKLRSTYFSQCESLHCMRLLPPIPDVPFQRAQIEVTLYVRQEHDHDNAVARVKWGCDLLEYAGYIEKDSPRFLEWAGLPKQVIGGGHLPHLEILLRDRTERK